MTAGGTGPANSSSAFTKMLADEQPHRIVKTAPLLRYHSYSLAPLRPLRRNTPVACCTCPAYLLRVGSSWSSQSAFFIRLVLKETPRIHRPELKEESYRGAEEQYRADRDCSQLSSAMLRPSCRLSRLNWSHRLDAYRLICELKKAEKIQTGADQPADSSA